jgi:RHS repeat-associated protein
VIASTALVYDDQGRVMQVSSALSGTNIAAYGYAYDVDNSTGLSTMLGQRTSLTASVPAQGFTNALTKYYYDPLYQLTRADYPNVAPFSGEIDSWTYDAIGNRLTSTVNGVPATYTYLKNGANPLNGQRLSNDGVNAYTWDNNGSNLTRNGTPGNFTFGYSVDNRLGSISGAATATYTYDYQGRRTSKTVGGVTTTYLYDGLNLVTETTGGNPVNYAFGPKVDQPLAIYQSGSLGYVSADALGSTSILSGSTGSVQNSYVFDVWGSTRASTATLTDSFGYTGREFGEAGLLNYRARYLQVGVGRFTQEDPIGFHGGDVNWFDYVFNEPVQSNDPTGLFTIDPSCDVCIRPDPKFRAPSSRPIDIQSQLRFGGAWGCAAIPPGIQNKKLRNCINRRCGGEGRIQCSNCSDPSIGGYTDGAGSSTLCLNNWGPTPSPWYLGNLIIHEFAHACGWTCPVTHGGVGTEGCGDGVPDYGNFPGTRWRPL